MKAAVLEVIGQPMVIDDIDVADPVGREVLVEAPLLDRRTIRVCVEGCVDRGSQGGVFST